MNEKKTILEWTKDFGCEMIDAKGFDKRDKNLYNKQYTKDEFIQGFVKCKFHVKRKPIGQSWLTKLAGIFGKSELSKPKA